VLTRRSTPGNGKLSLPPQLSTLRRPVAINDLHAFAAARLAEIQRPQNVHFTDAGSKALAGQAATAIKTAFGK